MRIIDENYLFCKMNMEKKSINPTSLLNCQTIYYGIRNIAFIHPHFHPLLQRADKSIHQR